MPPTPTTPKQNWLSLYQEIKITSSKSNENKIPDKINIVLKNNINPSELPYSNIETMSKAALSKMGAERMNNSMVVARGDSRSPEEIFEAGGFHPQFTNPDKKPKSDAKVLDFSSHQNSIEEGSGFVSFTTSTSVAKNFAKDQMGDPGYLYLAKATGAITTMPRNNLSSFEKQMFQAEAEYAVPGGVDAESIIAIRKKGDEGNLEGSLFISKAFMEKYPDKVEAIIQTCLEENEKAIYQKSQNLGKSTEQAKSVSQATSDSKEKTFAGKPLKDVMTEPKREVQPLKPSPFQLIAKLIETHASKMQPTDSLTRKFYSAKLTFSSLPPEQKNVALTAATIQKIHSTCNSTSPEGAKLIYLREDIQKKVQELEAKKLSGKLYPGCNKSEGLNVEDLKTNIPHQYKFIIALHLALPPPKKTPDQVHSQLMENLQIAGFFPEAKLNAKNTNQTNIQTTISPPRIN